MGCKQSHTAAAVSKFGHCDNQHDSKENHITISRKMVERLITGDAALAGGEAAAAAATERERETMNPSPCGAMNEYFAENLKKIDDLHSEKTGLNIDEVKAYVMRVNLRSGTKPLSVCSNLEDQLIECYHSNGRLEDSTLCWATIGQFSKCVDDAHASRLQDVRMQKDERGEAWLSKHVTRAWEQALKNSVIEE